MTAACESVAPISAPRRAVGILQAALNLLVTLLFILLAVASYQRFAASASLRSFGLLAVNGLFLVLFLARRRPASETRSLGLWMLAFAGTAASLLMRPSEHGGLAAGYAVQVLGLVLLTTALLSLRRSFAIVPGNRGVQQGGLYRLVRHPVYVSELIVVFGMVLTNPTPYNAAIWICECALQIARACAEERFLSADPVYLAYLERVRYRLLPGLI